MDLIVYIGDEAANMVMDEMALELARLRGRGWADCTLCGTRVWGKSLGEILQRLGEHDQEQGCLVQVNHDSSSY